MSPDEYMEAKRYLRLLAHTVTALQEGTASNYLNGHWVAKGKNVAELVQFMAKMGMWFAPATPGDESAYLALYHKLAEFDAALPRRSPAEMVSLPQCQLNTDAFFAFGSAEPENAERLLTALLADPVEAKRPSLWRQAARVAEQRKQYDIARQRLERVLTLEAKQPHDLAALRRDYGWWLSLAYQLRERVDRAAPRSVA